MEPRGAAALVRSHRRAQARAGSGSFAGPRGHWGRVVCDGQDYFGTGPSRHAESWRRAYPRRLGFPALPPFPAASGTTTTPTSLRLTIHCCSAVSTFITVQ